jgi:hypothetical protein
VTLALPFVGNVNYAGTRCAFCDAVVSCLMSRHTWTLKPEKLMERIFNVEKPLSLEQKIQAYDEMVEALRQYQRQELNICNFHKEAGETFCRRGVIKDNGCCYGCKYFGTEGCTVTSLACTRWMCGAVLDYLEKLETDETHQLHKKFVEYAMLLTQVSQFCELHGIRNVGRHSKEEDFESLKNDYAPKWAGCGLSCRRCDVCTFFGHKG